MKAGWAWVAVLTVCACVPSTAPEGGEGQRCYPNGTCDGDLRCLSDRCVRVPWDAGPDAGPDVPGDTTGDSADPGGPDSKDHQPDLDTAGTDETGASEDAGDPGIDLRDEGLAEDLAGEDACTPDCQGRECGNDGCGGSCGACGAPWECTDGLCLPRNPLCPGGHCPVPAGTFWMGSNVDDTQCPSNAKETTCYNPDPLPCHEVSVPAFTIDAYETTVAQYGRCVRAGACQPNAEGGRCNSWYRADRMRHPVDCIHWKHARDYCQWAGRRLCSEAEWERAARGDDGRMYAWGNLPPTCERAVLNEGEPGGHGCGTGSTWEVGSKPAGIGPFGAHDLTGNVFEWVQDGVAWDYSGTPTDGSAWQADPDDPHIVRGGGYEYSTWYAKASCRFEGQALTSVGFRCCGPVGE